MTDREKLIELLKTIPQVNHAQAAVEGIDYVFWCAADHLIANGVTFAKDNDAPTRAAEGGKTMKCCECPEYKACRREADLRRVRHRCSLAKAPPKPQTNADRIRAMSDEELAAVLEEGGFCPGPFAGSRFCVQHKRCKNCCLDYLRQPVKYGEGE